MNADAEFSNAWEESYSRLENHLFYPSDDVVRFVSRYLRRQTGIGQITDIFPGAGEFPIIDVCCGIGRNLAFGTEMELNMYGIDLSQHAVDHAQRWLAKYKVENPDQHVVQGDIRQLPWQDNFFGHGFCESALDSMPLAIAEQGVAEISRVIKPGGYFYCSLISGRDSGLNNEFDGELVVDKPHERNTVQSYFTEEKLRLLLQEKFEILSLYLNQTQIPATGEYYGRWHVICRNMA